MRNISFDNPYLLLIAVPLLLAVIIPYAIAIRKDNRSRSVIASLAMHIVIIICVTLAASGVTVTTVMTKTQVVVLADVSYSLEDKSEQVDDYVSTIKDALPTNSEMALVCFGRDTEVLAPMGSRSVPSVSESHVDGTATDVVGALGVAAGMFEDDVIKRVVLVTDARMTDGHDISDFIDRVDELGSSGIRVDAMFVDSSLAEGDREIQLSGVSASATAYFNHESTLDVLVQSNYDTDAVLTLYLGENEIARSAAKISKGYNIVNFDLQTAEAGVMKYRVEVSAEGDLSDKNNSMSFSQTVRDDLKVLLVSSLQSDLDAAEALYGERADIDAYIKPVGANPHNPKAPVWTVPNTIEELCVYDEIILANTDVRELFAGKAGGYTSFIDSVEQAVSLFGKSLVVVGDTKIQNKTDDILSALEDMLPVKYGNDISDPRLYGIVIDISRSMYQAGRFEMAKTAATYILNLISDNDYVCVITVAATSEVLQHPVPATERNEIAKKIANITEPVQGTCLSAGLKNTYDEMIKMDYEDMQVVLISDGLSFTDEPAESWDHAKAAYDSYGIITSCINPNTTQAEGIDRLKKTADYGKGEYYAVSESNLKDVLLSDVADKLTETIVEKPSRVNVKRFFDSIVKGVESLEQVNGFICSKAKASANTPITVDYVKSEGAVVEVPLYSYWDYGNGTVSCFTSQLSGAWVSGWGEGTSGGRVLDNILSANTPSEKVDYAYTLTVEQGESSAYLEIIPAVIHPDAKVEVTLTRPDGTTAEANMIFANSYYYYRTTAPMLGEYIVRIDYSYGKHSFSSESRLNYSYFAEYDEFAVCDVAVLHSAIRNRGTITTDGTVDLENDEKHITTYKASYVVPLLIIAVALFVVDIIIRKIKWADIRTLFKKKGGAA